MRARQTRARLKTETIMHSSVHCSHVGHARRALPILIALTASALAPAQGLAARAPTQFAAELIPVHTAPEDVVGGSYGTWAAGRDYKVSFDDGVAFWPYTQDARHAGLHWRWRTIAIATGEVTVAAAAPTRRLAPTRVEFDHGNVCEAWDVHPDHVEQTFVLAQHPGPGDLRIDGRVDGGLRCAPRPAEHGALTFCTPDNEPLVQFGAAVAIDGLGRRTPLRTEWRDGVLSLHVESTVLATAAYPLTIDPIVHNGAVHRGNAEIVAIDLFRDDQESTRNLWVAYAYRVSADDIDLVVVRADETQPALGTVTVFADVTNNWSALEVRLAGIGGQNRTIAAFTRSFPLSGSIPTSRRAVRWHAHAKDDLALSTAFGTVGSTPEQHDWLPAIGGSSAFAVGRFAMLVFQRERAPVFQPTLDSDVFAMRIDLSTPGQGSATPLLPVAAVSGRDEELPAINPEADGGPLVRWLVAWQERDGGGDDFEVMVRAVDSGGTISTARLATQDAGADTADKRDPRIAGLGGRYLLVYRSRDRDGGLDRVRAQRIDWPDDRASGQLPHPFANVDGSTLADFEIGSLAFDTDTRSHFGLTLIRTRGNRHDADLNAFRLGFRGQLVEVERLFTPGNPFEQLRSGAPIVYDDDNARYRLLYAAYDGVADVVGAATLTQATVVPERSYGITCATARLDWIGHQRIGSEFESLRALLPTGTNQAILLLSLRQGDIDLGLFGMPGCRLLVDLTPGSFIASVPVSAPNTVASLALPLLENYGAMTLDAQAVYFTAAGLVTSPGMEVQLVR